MLDRRKPKPVFPDRREGHRRRITFKIPARLIFSADSSRTDIPVGYQLTEDADGDWCTRVNGRHVTLTDPIIIRKLWANDEIDVDYVSISVPTPAAAVPAATPPPTPPAPPTPPHDALMVTTSVVITERDDNTTREVPTGCVLLRRSAEGPWEVMVGQDVLTLRDNVVQRGLQNGWFQHMSSVSELEEHTVMRHMEALIQRTTAHMNETLLGVGTSLTEAVRNMAGMNRNINQPGMFSQTTVTVTQPAPLRPQAEPKEAAPPPSAIDQILADDE